MLDHVGPFVQQPPFDVVRRLGDQLLENVPRDILTQAEMLGENGIALGALDHVQEPEFGEMRASIGRDRIHDFPVASGHQHVGDPLLESLPFGDREQMRLALDADIGDQRIRLQPLGLPKNRAGDLDRIVKSQFMDDVDRSTAKRASRFAKCARAVTSISSASRPMTSPKVHISSSL